MTSSTIVGTCHCRAISYTVSLPTKITVPLEGTYDHSADLRLSIGFHCTLHTVVPSEYFTTKEADPAKLVAYTTATSKTLFFCERCGATLFFRDELEKGKVAILAPTIDISASAVGGKTAVTSLRDLVVPKRHVFLGETFRGGVSRYMEDGLPRFTRGVDGKLWEPEEQERDEKSEGKDKEQLEGSCYCGGVKFRIDRADENYKEDVILKEWVKP